MCRFYRHVHGSCPLPPSFPPSLPASFFPLPLSRSPSFLDNRVEPVFPFRPSCSNRRACPSLHPSLQVFLSKICATVRTSAHCVHVVPLPAAVPILPPTLPACASLAGEQPRLPAFSPRRWPSSRARRGPHRIPAGSSLRRAHPARLTSASPEARAQNCGGPDMRHYAGALPADTCRISCRLLWTQRRSGPLLAAASQDRRLMGRVLSGRMDPAPGRPRPTAGPRNRSAARASEARIQLLFAKPG